MNNRDYIHYIILSSPGCGEKVLRSVLRKHEQIVARTEVFNRRFYRNKDFGPHTDAAVILRQFIFRTYPNDTKAVGFIIKRSGTSLEAWPDLWDLLKQKKDLRIINLHRRNLLRRHLTVERFKRNGIRSTTISPHTLDAQFQEYEKELKEFSNFFKDHKLLNIAYEDLCARPVRTTKSIMRFLGVKPEKLWPRLYSPLDFELKKRVANYSELKKHYLGTNRYDFFDDHTKYSSNQAPTNHFNELDENWGIRTRVQYLFARTKDRLLKLYYRSTIGSATYFDALPTLGRSYYSQNREELIIRSFFRDIRNAIFVDVGCAWPIRSSNTYYLEKHLNWSGLAVDANISYQKDWQRIRPQSVFTNFVMSDHHSSTEKFYAAGGLGSVQKERKFNAKIIRGSELRVPSITLNKLLDIHALTRIDFLSIDIEESEQKALAGFDIQKYGPKLVCIERSHNPKVKKRIHQYFESNGYGLRLEFTNLDSVNWYFSPVN